MRVEITEGSYAAQWGLTDFYDDCEKKFREVYESGKDFEVSWGCKKEVRYAVVRREKGKVYIEVTSYMDDLYDDYSPLVYDALWETEHMEKEISEEMMNEILDEAIERDIRDTASDSIELDASEEFESMCKAVEACEESAEEILKDMFGVLCEIVSKRYKKG